MSLYKDSSALAMVGLRGSCGLVKGIHGRDYDGQRGPVGVASLIVWVVLRIVALVVVLVLVVLVLVLIVVLAVVLRLVVLWCWY